MAKFPVKNVTVQLADGADITAVADMLSELHADIIERRLKASGLSAEQQIEVIDKIAEKLKTNKFTEI